MQNSRATPKGLGKIGAFLSRLNPPNLLAGLIIFFSATQLGFHFWPLSSLVYGIRIDYLSPTIYLLDILIILFLVLRRLLDRRPELRSSRDAEGGRSLLAGILPILLVNLLYSASPLATLSWSLHFILYSAFLRTVLQRNSRLQVEKGSAAAERTVLAGTLSLALTLALLFQLLLASSQVVLGHSVGGLLYYVGERSVAVGQSAVALGSFVHEVVLRAYGTFGHPNVLAGWAVISLLIILRLFPRTLLKRKTWLQAKLGSAAAERRVLTGISLVFTTLIVLLTQSRAAALSLFGLVIPFYLLKNLKSRAIYFFVSLLACWLVGSSLLSPTRSDLSRSERRTLQGASLSVVRAFPIFGSGAQASTSTYPSVAPKNRLLQPDHNSFTLFLSWFGIFGILAILYSLRPLPLPSTIYHLLPLAPLLALDHYLLTSPQGLFIFMVYLTLALNYSHVQNHRQ